MTQCFYLADTNVVKVTVVWISYFGGVQIHEFLKYNC